MPMSLRARAALGIGLAALTGWLAPQARAFDFIYDLPATPKPGGETTVIVIDETQKSPVPTTEEGAPVPGDDDAPAPPLDTDFPGGNPPAQHTPEPATLVTGLLGCAAAGWYSRRRRTA